MTTFSALVGFTAEISRARRRRTVLVVGVQTLATVAQGVGLLLLVPLLAIAGVHTGSTTTSSSIVRFWRRAFRDVGLPVSLGTVLSVYVLSVAASAAFNGYSGVLIARCRLEFVDGLRNRLYAAVAAAEWRHLAGLRRANLLTALTVDVNWVASGTQAVLTALATVIFVGVQITVAAAVSPLATLVTVVTGTAVTALVWPLVRRSRVLGQGLVTENRNVVSAATDFFEGLKLSKAHGLEASHVGTFERSVTRLRRSQIDFARTSAVSSSLQVVATVAVLAVVADVALAHLHTDVVGLLVLALVFSRVIPQLTQLQRLVLQVSQAVPAFAGLTDLIADCEHAAEAPTGQDPGRIALRNSVVLSGVGYVPPTGPAILHDIDLALPALRTTALVGPSGAGKTTLADVVVGLLEPTTGSLSVDARPLDPDLRRAWRNTIALVPQDPFLFHDTIRANLSWVAPAASEQDMWTALETAAARDFVAALPGGLDTVVDDRGSRLSGGERQRIALARALLRRPDLLVLDEATSALDTENETAIRHALAALHGQLTVLIIAHRLSTVRAADSLVVMDGGRIVESGTWNELLAGGGRLRSLIDAGEAR